MTRLKASRNEAGTRDYQPPRKKIFATIWPDERWGMVKVTPEQQAKFRQADPGVLVHVKNGWGEKGATNIRLESADPTTVQSALVTAWRNIAPKKLAEKLEEEDRYPCG